MSTLGYHPYLHAEQQSKEMIDAIVASRKGLGEVAASQTTDDGRLFITGYSLGGYLAMATHRAMQASGATVTASVPASGPYALPAFLDRIVLGAVNLAAKLFMPLATTSYQRADGDLYTDPAQLYEDGYATGIESLLPSTIAIEDLIAAGRLPAEALFSSTTPVTGDAALDAQLALPSNGTYHRGFGSANLIRNQLRVDYARDVNRGPDGANAQPPRSCVEPAASPAHPLHKAAKRNDLRNWTPTAPTLLCGGNADPTVFWDANAKVMQTYWSGLPAGRVGVLDLDSRSTGTTNLYAPDKKACSLAKYALLATSGNSLVDNYHATHAPFCMAAVRRFCAQAL